MTLPYQHSIDFRVQYYETDAQGRVHHGQYINYFERGRVELLRASGQSYREFEQTGRLLVVAQMELQYIGGAEFDDLLRLTTTVDAVKGVRIRHSYLIERLTSDSTTTDPIVKGNSVIACVDRTGKVKPLPDSLRQLYTRPQSGQA